MLYTLFASLPSLSTPSRSSLAPARSWPELPKGPKGQALGAGMTKPRNPLHLDSIEGREDSMSGTLKYTTNYLQHS